MNALACVQLSRIRRSLLLFHETVKIVAIAICQNINSNIVVYRGFIVTEQSKNRCRNSNDLNSTLHSTWSRKHMANPHYCACVKYINLHEI